MRCFPSRDLLFNFFWITQSSGTAVAYVGKYEITGSADLSGD